MLEEVWMRVLIAPDSFKGSATAPEVAGAIATGWRRGRPDDEVATCPMGDGGEGTLEAFAAMSPTAQRIPVLVTGPDDQQLTTPYLLLEDGTAVVELAGTSGIELTDRRRPLQTHTRGFGQAIADALRNEATRLVLAIGGSGSTDGGVGMLRELGARFYAADGSDIGDGGGALVNLARVDLDGLAPLPSRGVQMLSDVTSPLLGPTGAAQMFGPQKGADSAQVAQLEQGLARLAAQLGVDPASVGAGAAGGTGYALLAWGAQPTSGAGAVAEAVRLGEHIAAADFVVTGEGRFDGQSGLGKVPSHVLRAAQSVGKPVGLIAGSIAAATGAYAVAISLVELAGSAAASMADPLRYCETAGQQMAFGADGT
jgi:glycerate kinase